MRTHDYLDSNYIRIAMENVIQLADDIDLRTQLYRVALYVHFMLF